MTLGAMISWVWLPSLQEGPVSVTRACQLPKRPSKTLETLAKGKEYATRPVEDHVQPDGQVINVGGDGEILSFSGKFDELRRRISTIQNGGYAPRA